MGDDRKAEYEMAPTSDPENPDPPAEKADLGSPTQEDSSQQWAGLSKEELLRVADTKAWNWTRNILLILFWIAWVLMLIVAIILVVKAPSCPDVEWYEKSSIYQVYLRSFKDGDDDGYGDLQGLIANIEEFKTHFGAETILLSPIFMQANGSTNFGQETVNFMDIDPTIGTLDQFDSLIEELQGNGMHVILEFDPNHSSNEHEWFKKSRAAKDEDDEYWDFYIWADSPNDWTNYRGESAWTRDDTRGQYYYHFYEPSQPDLNFRSENVKSKIKDVMSFWLGKKADGFVVGDVDRLLEAPAEVTVGRKKRQAGNNETVTDAVTELPPDMMMPTTQKMMDEGDGNVDGPVNGSSPEPSDRYPQYGMLGGDVTELPKDMVELLDDLNQVIIDNSYLGKFRVFIPQHSGPLKQNVLYERENWRGFPRSLGFVESLDDSTTSYTISSQVKELMDAKKAEGYPQQRSSWSVGHSRISRLASRTGANAKALLMLMFSLPGTPMPYYGEDLGLVDLGGANGQLGPYPWSGNANGGFSESNDTVPWMDVAQNLKEVNHEAQMDDKMSDLTYFLKLSELRQEPSLLAGEYSEIMVSSKLFAFTRQFPEWPRYLAVFNLGQKQEGQSVMDEAINGTVVLSASGEMMDKEVQLNKLTISEKDAYLIKY